MDHALLGLIGAIVIIVGDIPYMIGAWQRTVKPSLTSWSLWSFIWIVVGLTYDGSGAAANIWPVLASAADNIIITGITFFRQPRTWDSLERLDKWCLALSLSSLALFLGVHGSREWSAYALYLAIVADLVASLPTMVDAWKNPSNEPPFSWACFATGYVFATLAISDNTIANYSLPVYSFLGTMIIVVPLVVYRWHNCSSVREWIFSSE